MASTAQILTIPTKLNVHASLVESLLNVTRLSTHSYEMAVHRLLIDVMELHDQGTLPDHAYYSIIGTGIDVLFFFNYDHDLLSSEANIWYRASIIHQIGAGMLQSIERVRPDLTAKSFFREAMQSLALGIPVAHPATQCAPLHCRQWTKEQ